MKPVEFRIEQGEEELTSHSGMALVGALLGKTRLRERLDAVQIERHPKPEISHGENVEAMIGLLCLGKPDFDAIEGFRSDRFFGMALGLKEVPSSPTLRQRLDDVEGKYDAIVREESAEMVKRHARGITGTEEGFVPLDIDVSPFDNSGSKKEGVSWTYKQVEGYAPICAYLGREGYMVDVQLREGSQHCQKGTEGFLREAIGNARRITDKPLLVRLDSGNDSVENIGVCLEENAGWLIKRNLRKESAQGWLKVAQERGVLEEPRVGKKVYRGDIVVKKNLCVGQADEEEVLLRIVYEVVVRTIDEKGQMLLLPEVDVDTYWTSLNLPAERVITLYHEHGTSEQYHSELKTDMDLERLPSGKFATNALVLLLGMVAYNVLRLCGQESLRFGSEAIGSNVVKGRKGTGRRRLRSVIQDLMYMACRLVYHARQWILSFGRRNSWYGVWRGVYGAIASR